jgi:glutamate-5-semialdehyde dehydrogenase
MKALMQELGRAARAAAPVLASASRDQKDRALRAAAVALRRDASKILAANAQDMRAAEERDLSAALLDRLRLDSARIEAMARGLEDIASLPDPVGRVLAEWTRPNGLRIARVAVPLGVLGIIYESRPNVTADAGALCLKSGNAVILRGGSESLHSTAAIHAGLVAGLREAGLPESCVQRVPVVDREAVGLMLEGLDGTLDVVVPRGGKGLIERVRREARVPVIGHLDGNCHVYVDRDADLAMAVAITLNAKLRRTGVCGAAETLLVDRGAPADYLGVLVRSLLDAGCLVRGDQATQHVDTRVTTATEVDWHTEYLDSIIAVRVV